MPGLLLCSTAANVLEAMVGDKKHLLLGPDEKQFSVWWPFRKYGWLPGSPIRSLAVISACGHLWQWQYTQCHSFVLHACMAIEQITVFRLANNVLPRSSSCRRVSFNLKMRELSSLLMLLFYSVKLSYSLGINRPIGPGKHSGCTVYALQLNNAVYKWSVTC